MKKGISFVLVLLLGLLWWGQAKQSEDEPIPPDSPQKQVPKLRDDRETNLSENPKSIGSDLESEDSLALIKDAAKEWWISRSATGTQMLIIGGRTCAETLVPYTGWVKARQTNLGYFEYGLLKRLKRWRDKGIPHFDFNFTGAAITRKEDRYHDPHTTDPFEAPWYTFMGRGAEGWWELETEESSLVDLSGWKFNGICTLWHSNGQKHWEGHYNDGKIDGSCIDWYESGQRAGTSIWNQGNLLSAVSWKPDGEKCPRTQLLDGAGLLIGYHQNGQKGSERTYKGGKLHGSYKTWHENGRQTAERTYKDGKRHGLGTFWLLLDGNPWKIQKGNYKGGRRSGLWTTWHKDGQKATEEHYSDGKPHGSAKKWYENGQKEEEGTYKDGDRMGDWISWHSNGQKHRDGRYKDGKESGLWISWYENGQKEEEGTYKDGGRMGDWVRYSDDGSILESTRYYEDGDERSFPGEVVPKDFKRRYRGVSVDNQLPETAYEFFRRGKRRLGQLKTVPGIEDLEKALELYLDEHGPEHEKVLETYLILGPAYSVNGEHDKAIIYLEKLIEMQFERKIRRPRKALIDRAFAELAGEKGNPVKVLSRAAWQDDPVRLCHVGVTAYYLHLSNAYEAKGEYEKANEYSEKYLNLLNAWEEYKREAREKEIALLGIAGWKESRMASKDLNSSERTSGPAVAESRSWLEPEHEVKAMEHSIIAKIYNRKGDYDKAIEHLGKALDIHDDLKGKVRFGGIVDSVGLNEQFGLAYMRKGMLDKALDHFMKCLKKLAEYSYRASPAFANSYFNLALCYGEKGEYQKCLSHGLAALGIRLELFGSDHPEVVDAYKFLSSIHWRNKNHEMAETYAIKSLVGSEQVISKVFTYLSPARRLAFQRRHSPFDLLGTLGDGQALAQAALRHKGIVLDSIMEDELLVKRSDDPKMRALLQERKALGNLLTRAGSKPETLAEKVPALRKKMDDLDGRISKAIGGEDRARRALKVETKQVAAALPEKAVLVEFVKYWHLLTDDNASTKGEYRYGAVLIPSAEADPVWISLGPIKPIEEQLGELLKWGNKKSRSPREGYPRDALPELHRLVMAPILDKLPKSTDTLILSPDGMLNFLPFAALHKGSDQPFLAEQFDLLYVSSGRDLLDKPKPSAGKTAVVFADPDYRAKPSEAATTETLALVSPPSPNGAYRDLSFNPLPGTRKEADALKKLFAKEGYETIDHLGPRATEVVLREMRNPRIAHFATHGFFIENKEKLAGNLGQMRFFGFDRENTGPVDNPMRRAGIALAGAQATFEAWEQGKGAPAYDDGIVTAEEAAHLNLQGTWLTTLSACSTGSGFARAGEGVLGLRRAFAQAGTQNLLITLWPVSDTRTVDFMQAFYAEALKTGDAPRALAKTQRDMLRQMRQDRDIPSAVKYFAPFVLTFRGPLPAKSP